MNCYDLLLIDPPMSYFTKKMWMFLLYLKYKKHLTLPLIPGFYQ